MTDKFNFDVINPYDKHNSALNIRASNINIQNKRSQPLPRKMTLRKIGYMKDVLTGMRTTISGQFIDPPPGSAPTHGDCGCSNTDGDFYFGDSYDAPSDLTDQEAYALDVFAALDKAGAKGESHELDPWDINMSMNAKLNARRDSTVSGYDYSTAESTFACVHNSKPFVTDPKGVNQNISKVFAEATAPRVKS